MTTTLHELTTPSVLPLSIRRCGYELNQIHRSAYAAVYTVTDIETGRQHGFEVFEIRIQQARILPNGVHFAHKEIYPNNEAFGNWAFAPRTRQRAFERFAELELRALKKRRIEVEELAI